MNGVFSVLFDYPTVVIIECIALNVVDSGDYSREMTFVVELKIEWLFLGSCVFWPSV